MDATKIKIGTKLELELVNSLGEKIGQTYISQLLEAIDEENILIAAPIHESRLMFISNGTRIRIVFLHERAGLLAFHGIITNKEKSENLVIFKIKIESAFEKIQRRKYFRLDCNLNCAYRLVDEADVSKDTTEFPDSGPFQKALTKNLSGSGISIVTEEGVPKGSFLELSVDLPGAGAIRVICKVVRMTEIEAYKGKKFDLGLYFIKISQKDQDTIVRYVFTQQRLMLKNNLVDKG